MRVMSFLYLMRDGRRPGLESPSDQGRGTSEASGAWRRRVSGSVGMRRALAVQGLGDLRLPDPDKDRRRGWADSLRRLGRNGPKE